MASKKTVSNLLKSCSNLVSAYLDKTGAKQELMQKYGLLVGDGATPAETSAVRESLGRLPTKLALDCGIHKMDFEDLGPSMPYYPNHGKYIDGTLILNKRIVNDPKMERDDEGNEINKLDLIFFHEMGHGFDEAMAKGEMLCIEPEWLELSGWSDKPKKGLMQIVIKQPGKKTLQDPWYYNPKAGFPRYYGKRNPWDDWADAFAFYVGGVKGRLPENKRKYFDKHLGGYYA